MVCRVNIKILRYSIAHIGSSSDGRCLIMRQMTCKNAPRWLSGCNNDLKWLVGNYNGPVGCANKTMYKAVNTEHRAVCGIEHRAVNTET